MLVIHFEIPEYTSEVTGLGTMRMLEAIRFLKLKTKFIKQALQNYLEKHSEKSFKELVYT